MSADAETMLAQRLVALDGSRNFRDFGGYPAADGRIVRRGRLFRANRLSRLSADDCRRLDDLGIRTIFDLRARHEREADPTTWTGDHLETHVFRPGHFLWDRIAITPAFARHSIAPLPPGTRTRPPPR